MSRVYLAEDSRLGVQVAVKENLQPTPEARRQFEREARILARLSHPNLPGVIDHLSDQQTGRQYLVMDYIEGEDLQDVVKRTGPARGDSPWGTKGAMNDEISRMIGKTLDQWPATAYTY
jgi:serine/threonine-protein kinase